MPARSAPSSASSSASSLRAAYRYLQGGTVLAGAAALGLLPFLLALPLPAWQTAGLLFLVAAYFSRKAYQGLRAYRSRRQLRLEEQFLQQPLSARQLVRCLQQRRHLWAGSCAVRALRKLLMRPLPHVLVARRKKAPLQARYRRALAPVQPASSSLDLVLVLALLAIIGAATAHTGAVLPGARLLQGGVLAGPLLLLAELFQTACRRRAHRAFAQFTQALVAWTLAYGIDEVLRSSHRSAAYHHTLIYRAPSWFGFLPAAQAAPITPSRPTQPLEGAA